ncbi:hypothetical protein SNEBB_004583 [Seison nebaliae]|nr:hypothetical protein SNEBB_004583 [Seison nebaliae]
MQIILTLFLLSFNWSLSYPFYGSGNIGNFQFNGGQSQGYKTNDNEDVQTQGVSVKSENGGGYGAISLTQSQTGKIHEYYPKPVYWPNDYDNFYY